ncbi:hypothetical protein [Phaeovulum sp.]|nr:hypothetical protein [Phaeovulum sp.]MDP1669813.1 hypothetical protein [Phaeovulum sp.]MDZ4118731.1 hypothetical protein [Phaeovulum sp.]
MFGLVPISVLAVRDLIKGEIAPHSSLDGKAPDQAYFNQPMPEAAE